MHRAIAHYARTTIMVEQTQATPWVRKIQRAALTLPVIGGVINTMDRAALRSPIR
jgi:hypothetical protein